MISIDEIMQKIKLGSEDAMKELILRLNYPLHKLASYLLHDDNLSADVIQETFIQIWTKREQFNDNMPAWPWIARILRNQCHLIWRKNVRKLKQFEITNFEIESAEYIPSPIPTQEYTRELDQLLTFARDYISALSYNLREVVQLSIFFDLSEKEIAELLGIPCGTVKSRKSRGMTIIRSKMEALNQGDKNGNN